MNSLTLKKKLFSYDSVEDADIAELFHRLPTMQHSKYMRIALRLLIEQYNHTEPWQPPLQTMQQGHPPRDQTEDADKYHDGSNHIQKLGK